MCASRTRDRHPSTTLPTPCTHAVRSTQPRLIDASHCPLQRHEYDCRRCCSTKFFATTRSSSSPFGRKQFSKDLFETSFGVGRMSTSLCRCVPQFGAQNVAIEKRHGFVCPSERVHPSATAALYFKHIIFSLALSLPLSLALSVGYGFEAFARRAIRGLLDQRRLLRSTD